MAGARGCFNCGGCAWCFRVVVVACRRRVPCVQTHVPTHPFPFPPPFLSYHPWCGADGDRVFFYTLLYIDRAQSKLLSNPFRVHPIVTCVVLNSRTPGCELPKGGHTNLVNAFLLIRSLDRVNNSRVSWCVHLVSYNCESCVFSSLVSFLAVLVSGLLMVVYVMTM